MKFAFRRYFRTINVKGTENIPKEGPILFLCNHPSSFTEPMMLACFQDRILNFLVRGDVFENRFLRPILEATHQIPIFRARDGFENLRKNKMTFDLVYKKLSQNEAVLIFPESTTQLVRYLRPLQKGAAHMAITSVKDYNQSELVVIPCGANFTNAIKAGSDALILIGTPIHVKTWIDQQSIDTDLPSKLTEHFTQEMNKVVLSIPPDVPGNLYDSLSCLIVKKEDDEKILYQKHSKIIHALSLNKTELESNILKYSSSKGQTESVDYSIMESGPKKIFSLLKLFISFLVGIPAMFLFGLPMLISTKIAYHMVKNEFIPPIRIVFSIVFILLICIVVASIVGIKIGFAYGILSIFILLFSLVSFLHFIYFAPKNKYLFSLYLQRNRKHLIDLREKIIGLIEG